MVGGPAALPFRRRRWLLLGFCQLRVIRFAKGTSSCPKAPPPRKHKKPFAAALPRPREIPTRLSRKNISSRCGRARRRRWGCFLRVTPAAPLLKRPVPICGAYRGNLLQRTNPFGVVSDRVGFHPGNAAKTDGLRTMLDRTDDVSI